jgi:3-oxoacyl-[acyl-carrier protein] reductase
MQLNLAGKAALVTGSSRGIGRAIATALHAEGCCVALNGRNSGDLATATASLRGAIGIAGDVTRPDDARRIVDEATRILGKLDILVCNVGSGSSVSPGDETPDEWQRVFALNLWSVTNTVEAAKTALIVTNGVVVCISSICGVEVIPGAPITYSAAKAALHAYVRGIARPLGQHGIRINAVAPGNIVFDGSIWARKLAEDKFAVQTMLETNVVLKRFGSPEDVANLVTYLVSARSAYATGGIWTLDGGQVHS